ncbi:hypothetical protein D6850_01770 [Roseovarius spongiae]|uniref:Ribbon-helix-helix protein, CopG family n=1 Tax=Roseovarius spongiae TaxID=2320272 RepID=A0A3A8B414_9RHOB|nr:hypothetical protein [Roseovarius spongiae]RKF16311.1 hypothetical protein D6850_01770 [Roseovarius spongiae]
MRTEHVTLRLPTEAVQAVRRLAHARDITPGQFMREAIGAEIRRSTRNAKTPNRADEQLLGPLRVLLASDFARATSWEDLNDRLCAKGYALREAGGGLALHEAPGGARLCKASELGHAYGALMRRFGAPLPGHAHRHLADRILGTARPRDAPPDDFDVIEPF